MSPAVAALLAMLATAYLAIGAAWSFVVALVRILVDEPVTVRGVLGQALLWPLACWFSLRGGA